MNPARHRLSGDFSSARISSRVIRVFPAPAPPAISRMATGLSEPAHAEKIAHVPGFGRSSSVNIL